MTKINHERGELRLIDEARKRKKSAAHGNKESSAQEVLGFLDAQDAMGSALSVLHQQRKELIAELFKAFEHAFVNNDLNAYKKFIGTLTDADERSVCLRILNGTLLSHGFVIRDGQIEFEKRAKLEWRRVGVRALHDNLDLYAPSKKTRLRFNDQFEEKLSELFR